MAAKRISKPESLLAALGIIGMEPIEPVILGALIGGEPLLLVGPHGTGKSYLLTRISAALGLELRHYNASLLNYDDLVGYPLPNGRGGLEFIQTPASIWGANAVFIDEISRCRPDLQNKLFPIIHERRVQGILLDKLLYRWSAMNPPPPDEGEVQEPFYRGSEPLDTALADRFAFVVVMPGWNQFSESQQEQVILCAEDGAPDESSRRLKALVENGRALLASVRQELSGQVARYVRAVTALLAHAGVETSPRRAGMLLRNILAVHAADLARNLEAEAAASAYLALSHSLPHPAMGQKVDPVKVLASHKEAWKLTAMDEADPRRFVFLERDPLVRAVRASQVTSLKRAEFSTIVADCLAALPAGARHALAAFLFDSGVSGRLVAAVAEQCAALYALAATPQDVTESVITRGTRHLIWGKVVELLARLNTKDPDTPLAANLFAGLFSAGELAREDDVAAVWNSWSAARKRLAEVTA